MVYTVLISNNTAADTFFPIPPMMASVERNSDVVEFFISTLRYTTPFHLTTNKAITDLKQFSHVF